MGTTADRAQAWLECMDITLVGEPIVCESLDGPEVVFEWWYCQRKVSVRFDDLESGDSLLRIWAPNMHTGMSEHVISKEDTIAAFKWLMERTCYDKNTQ